ncbi:LysE family translocator [Tropicibacter sp. R15_0]|uniref:LysE family translocator n=1 Tax=Tropicibacter sp. R15_0 TaxID=2821101 RepID=UPI001ADCF12D|nr:LysE family translocator [Tropicibacter sp. R15_0]MBO9467864.1 LysE family translocator [Tropicibacter sp. R15_0]
MPSLLPIALFAFTMSFVPGPVNVITLASGLQNGVAKTIAFVSGATIGFAGLLLILGLGLAALPEGANVITDGMTLAGAALILYIALPLFRADALQQGEDQPVPGFLQGALLQWLNPKAWGAILAALSLFNLRPGTADLYVVIALWSLLCFIGVGVWAVFGAQLARVIQTPAQMRLLCRAMGSVLITLVALFLWQWARG